MARYTRPTTRISRRFGQQILGSGKAFERRAYPPGVHGAKMRRKVSEYAVGLNEKQKLRYIYGLLERQFRRTFAIAKKERGVTGERFLQLLETRLDSVVYLLGFAHRPAPAPRSRPPRRNAAPPASASCASSSPASTASSTSSASPRAARPPASSST